MSGGPDAIRSDNWSREFTTRPILVVKPEKTFVPVNDAEVMKISESQPAVMKEPPRTSPRGKSAKQISWLLILKAHKFAGLVAWFGMFTASLLNAIQERLKSKKENADEGLGEGYKVSSGRILLLLRILLVFSLFLLGFEVISHTLGWELLASDISWTLTPSSSFATWGTACLQVIYIFWKNVRLNYVAPIMKYLSDSCVYLFLLQSADRLILVIGCAWIKLTGYKPIAKGTYEEDADPERPGASYPMVLVQIPMCNEREVYEVSIAAACSLDWPQERLLIQVLDDSSETEIQELIKAEVQIWAHRGVPIVYRHRLERKGYKAGNLHSAMSCDYVKNYEFVAIFDADFQPRSDFLKRTVIHFKDQPEVGLVQARWAFVNREENLLTRLQNINLAFHFEVEQQVNGAFLNFFGFNGTAGVWRISALEDSGGWLDRTTVEDMDIAVRAHLKGWKMVFLNDVEALCELPESYEAYRKQQHRWHSGPMQLFKLTFWDIVTAKISVWKKMNVIFLFFLLRKMILPFYSFTLFCIVLPLTMFVPEASLPLWVVCYVPVTMSMLNVLPSPKSFPFLVPYLLFENCMSVTKFNAMVVGLFHLGSAYEWVVTKKSGRGSESDLAAIEKNFALTHKKFASESDLSLVECKVDDLKELSTIPTPKPQHKKKNAPKLYHKELALAFLLLISAVRSLFSVGGMHFYFLLFQGLAFLAVGMDVISDERL